MIRTRRGMIHATGRRTRSRHQAIRLIVRFMGHSCLPGRPDPPNSSGTSFERDPVGVPYLGPRTARSRAGITSATTKHHGSRREHLAQRLARGPAGSSVGARRQAVRSRATSPNGQAVGNAAAQQPAESGYGSAGGGYGSGADAEAAEPEAGQLAVQENKLGKVLTDSEASRSTASTRTPRTRRSRTATGGGGGAGTEGGRGAGVVGRGGAGVVGRGGEGGGGVGVGEQAPGPMTATEVFEPSGPVVA